VVLPLFDSVFAANWRVLNYGLVLRTFCTKFSYKNTQSGYGSMATLFERIWLQYGHLQPFTSTQNKNADEVYRQTPLYIPGGDRKKKKKRLACCSWRKLVRTKLNVDEPLVQARPGLSCLRWWSFGSPGNWILSQHRQNWRGQTQGHTGHSWCDSGLTTAPHTTGKRSNNVESASWLRISWSHIAHTWGYRTRP
jgi:hypothetical protein